MFAQGADGGAGGRAALSAQKRRLSLHHTTSIAKTFKIYLFVRGAYRGHHLRVQSEGSQAPRRYVMRVDVRIRKLGKKKNTFEFKLLGESPPMENFYPNLELVSSLPFDTEEIVLNISSEPFADGEVALAFPPVPFFKEFTDVVRYEHRTERRGKDRRAPNTPDLGVTLAYVNKVDLEDEFVADQQPIFFGLSPVADADSEDQKRAAAEDVGAGDEIDRAAAFATFDDFLRDSVRVKRGSRLTSRQIWDVWAARWGANPNDRVIAGVRFTDVARRFHAVFGATTATNPTRIDGRLQRYWPGYTV